DHFALLTAVNSDLEVPQEKKVIADLRTARGFASDGTGDVKKMVESADSMCSLACDIMNKAFGASRL
ncbi:unnamed protein product, partial [Effrenium voratum]